MTDIDLTERFEVILDAFDFSKVLIVMSHLSWTWAYNKTVPTIEEMKDMCCELFDDILNVFNQEGKTITVSSGGFEVTIYSCFDIELKFVLTRTNYEAESGETY